MTLQTWTAASEVYVGCLVRRGVLIGRFDNEVEARKDFASSVAFEPQLAFPGVRWSETAEALIAREAWNAITCEHVAGCKLIALARHDLPEVS